MLKIGITGPESTGKTTLAQALGKHYQCIWVHEFARQYLQNKTHYQQEDLLEIARGQWKSMQNENSEEDIIIYDTEMTVIKIWSQFKYGNTPETIEEFYQFQKLDMYLLCDIDIPWAYDPLRENPNDRDQLKKLYLEALENMNRPFLLLSGDINSRIKEATQFIDQYLKK